MSNEPIQRRGKLEELDRSLDYQFWRSQTPSARFEAMWELIVHAYRVKGQDVRQLPLQRSVERYGRQRR